jgi:microcystin-dependent protein
MWTTTSAPTGWLLCDGSSVSTTTYASLFTLIGYAFGGSGANFNVPDLRDKVALGVGTSNSIGQTNRGATTSQSANTSANQSADHTHTGNTGNDSANHTHSYSKSGASNTASMGINQNHTHSITTGGVSAGHTHSLSAHTHTTPDLVLNYIIKT